MNAKIIYSACDIGKKKSSNIYTLKVFKKAIYSQL